MGDMNRMTVPGGWVEFREPEEVPEKHRRKVMRLSPKGAMFAKYTVTDPNTGQDTIDATSMTEQEQADALVFMSEFNDAIAVALINAWSWDFAVTEENLLELPGAVYDAVIAHAIKNTQRLMPRFSPDDAADPKAPTASF